jgi:hypothetical protein
MVIRANTIVQECYWRHKIKYKVIDGFLAKGMLPIDIQTPRKDRPRDSRLVDQNK